MRYAFVTGGSRGIGKAIAVKLAKMGMPVVINYRSNDDAAQSTRSEIEAFGGKAELLRFDVSDPQATEEALSHWEEKHPDDYISVLVNNAGIRRDNLMIFMQNEEWDDVLKTPLNGFFYVTISRTITLTINQFDQQLALSIGEFLHSWCIFLLDTYLHTFHMFILCLLIR